MEVVEIPGEATFWRSYAIPPVRVDLPLRAYAGGGYAAYVVITVLTCLLLAVGLLAMVDILITGETGGWLQSAWIGFLVIGVMYALLGVLPLLVFRTRDLFRRGPALTVTGQGLRDARAALAIGWGEVAAARITTNRQGISGVDLTLRSGPRPCRAVFARGGFGPLMRPRDGMFHLDIQWLSVRPRTLAHTVTTLVAMHGGEVET